MKKTYGRFDGMTWETNYPEMIGYIPEFLTTRDSRNAVQQINDRYAHGGGWNDFAGFTVEEREDGEYQLVYPGDPAMREVGRTQLRDELVVVFQYSWVMVKGPERTRIARLD